MGGTCSRVSETECPGYNCDGLEKCYTCEATGIGDNAGIINTDCYVQNELLFVAVILPLMIFFAIIGVYILHKSRIKRSTNINLCLQSMDGRQWGATIIYLFFEVAVLGDIYFWIAFGVGRPDKGLECFLLGILFFALACIFACCGCGKYGRYSSQEPAPVNMGVALVSDPNVRFHTAPGSVVSGQAPTPVVPGYPVSDGYYHALGAVGGAPSQVGQPAIAPPAAPVSGGGVYRYPMSDGVYTAAPVTVGVAPSQVVHGSGGSYHPQA
jgi:hypothetical protein